jgi:hypothetical protein
VVTRFPDFLWDIEHNSPSLKMQPHTQVALGFTTGLEVLCGGAAHAQPDAQTPASAEASYNTTLTTLRGAGRMPDREDGTSGSDEDGDGSPSVRGQGPLRGRGRGRGRGGGRSRRGRDADGDWGGATGRAHGGAVGADGSSANVAQIDMFRSDRHVCQNVLVAHLYHVFLQLPFSEKFCSAMGT